MVESEWIFDSFLVPIFQIHFDWWLPEIKTRNVERIAITAKCTFAHLSVEIAVFVSRMREKLAIKGIECIKMIVMH
jgi:hypothetical protein